MDEKIPEKIGPYKIISKLAKGGMSDVYKAVQGKLNRYVALKVLPVEFCRAEKFLERFNREAQAVAKLHHHNIVGLYDYGVEGADHFFALRYVEGINLGQKLKKEKRIDQETTVSYAKQILRALKYAHENNVTHRDIKPQNILLGDNGNVYVIDFGIAAIVGIGNEDKLTKTGVVVGTPEYMSPQQVQGLDLNFQTDLYSLGIVMYEMLTGDPPFTGNNAMGIAYKHVNVDVDSISNILPSINTALERVVLKALKKDLNNRYQSASEFLDDLDRVFTVTETKNTRSMNYEKIELKQEKDFAQRTSDRRGGAKTRLDRRKSDRRDFLGLDNKGNRRWYLLALFLLFSFIGLFVFNKQSDLNANSTTPNWEFLFDEDVFTSWNGPINGNGIKINFNSKQSFNKINIYNGDNSGNDFNNYSRPKRLLLIFDERESLEIELKDIRNRQTHELIEKISCKNIEIKFLSFFNGLVKDTVSISEISFGN